MSNHQKLHNQNYIGPGVWFKLHTDCAWANTIERKKCVVEQIKNLQENFPCNDCKSHFGDYLKSHPLEATLNDDPESLFLWSVKFHNAVNFRLKKPQVSYEDAKSIYYNNSVFCMSDCNAEAPKVKTPPKKTLRPMGIPSYIL
jgi:hypothetical protein